jgi:preprotein translocase subunit SecA
MDMRLRALDPMVSGLPQPASGQQQGTGEPEAVAPSDQFTQTARPRNERKADKKQLPADLAEVAPVPATTSVPTALAQLDEPVAPVEEDGPAAPPPATPRQPPTELVPEKAPSASRVVELPKGPKLLQVLSGAIRASKRIGLGLLSVVGTDPLKQVQAEQKKVNDLEPVLDAAIAARASELRAAGQTGDVDLEAARQVLQGKTVEFRKRLADGQSLDSMKIEAFAVARKAAQVVLKMRPYDVQVQGGLAMTEGRISEMKTGEGKTLTAVMPLYLYGLTGKGAHLVTVNDYLVKRDYEQMKPAFEFLGLSVGCVHEGVENADKKKAYACDVTYVTNHSLGFDFLRDQSAREPELRVQRAPHFALVDEVDEILIDEARTPLILSSLSEAAGDEHRIFDILVKSLEPGRDFKTNQKDHYAYVTDEGLDRVECMLAAVDADEKRGQAALKLRSLPPGTPMEEVQAASRAFDQAHKASQAAQKLVQAQNLLRTSTTEEEKQEAQAQIDALRGAAPSYSLYSLDNVRRVFFLQNALMANALYEKDQDYLAANDQVQIVDVFKGRTMDGRRFTNGLHQALEAKEGVTIQPYQRTQASITYPDLFRRYPHLAGMSGTAMSAASEFHEAYKLDVVAIPTNKPKDLKTDHDIIFRTMQEKFEYVADRIEELYKEGKPVLVGTRSIPANKYLSHLLAKRGIYHQVLNAERVQDNTDEEARILADAGRSGMVTLATNMAGRGVDIKPDLVNYKLLAMKAEVACKQGEFVVVDVEKPRDAEQVRDWLASDNLPTQILAEGQAIQDGATGIVIRIKPTDPPPEGSAHFDGRTEEFETGGLHLIMTERHEAERIDLQLEGRPARQGQPGYRLAVLSLEDELLQYFGGPKLAEFFDAMGIPPGKGVSDERLDEMVREAQRAVEGKWYEVRKDTTKYGEVLNKQREAFSASRDKLVNREANVGDLVLDWLPRSLAHQAFYSHAEREWVAKGSQEDEVVEVPGSMKADAVKQALTELSQKFGVPFDVDLGKKKKVTEEELEELLRPQVEAHYQAAAARMPAEDLAFYQRKVLLDVADEGWMNHLENMEALRHGIGMEAYAQKDPWIQYQHRAFDMYQGLLQAVQYEASSEIFRQMLIEAREQQTKAS